MRRIPERVLAAAVLLGAIAVAFASVIFGGRSLVATNAYNPLDAAPSAANYGPGFDHFDASVRRNFVVYANQHDPGVAWWQWEPSGEFLRKSLRDGEFPLWDPWVAGGAPAMSNLTGCFFFPPYLLLMLAGNGVFLQNLYFLFLIFIAGWFTFLLLRAHGLGVPAGLTAAIAFMFSGSIVSNVNTMLGQTWACIPFALYLTVRLLQQPALSRIAALAAGYAAVALSSFPPLLMALFGTCAAYVIVQLLSGGDSPRLRIAVAYCAACLLALGLVAFYYLPSLGVYAATPQVHKLYDDAGSITVKPSRVLQLLSPYLLGGSAPVLAESSVPDQSQGFPYVGVTVAALALISWPDGRRQRVLYLSMAVVLVLVVLKIIGAPGVQWLGRMPVLRTMHFVPYFSYVTNFSLAVLAGFGMERLLRGKVSPARSLLASMILLAAVLALGYYAIRYRLPSRPHFDSWANGWRTLTLIAALSGLALVAGSAARRPRWLAAAACLAFGALCIEAYIHTVYPRPRRWNPWKNPPPYVRRLSTDPSDRVFNIGGLHANASSAFGIAGTNSLFAFNPPRMYDLYRTYINPEPSIFMDQPQLFPGERVLDALAVTQIVISEASPDMWMEAEQRHYRLTYREPAFSVFRRNSRPHHFFTTEYRVPAAGALRALEHETKRGEILLEHAASFPSSPNTEAVPVVLRKFSRNGQVLGLNAPRPGLVYSSESFFPGWTAKVNGKCVPVLAADHAFRAVEVPAGPVIVEYRYEPALLKSGFALSGAAIAACAALLVLSRRNFRWAS